MTLIYPDGVTPIDPDEAAGLIPNHITTQKELNEWESVNIRRAREWVLNRKRNNLLTVEFIKELHRKMFDQTWKWAGMFRRSDKNIGVPWASISVEVRKCLDDIEYWFANSVHPLKISAVKAHHKLAMIHPFPNGNGRHARLFTDVLLYNVGLDVFKWGDANLDQTGAARREYIKALQSADRNDFTPLYKFLGIEDEQRNDW